MKARFQNPEGRKRFRKTSPLLAEAFSFEGSYDALCRVLSPGLPRRQRGVKIKWVPSKHVTWDKGIKCSFLDSSGYHHKTIPQNENKMQNTGQGPF